ncbi:MAG: hypothetical protein LUE26_08860 [Alistipes sp.]|nr:hypothetical protein [Alistipes sp.]
MKHYEVIYCSSARSWGGGNPGFGIRTMTPGMPEEYISLLKSNGLLAYNSGSFVKYYPDVLISEPEKLAGYPVTYTYRKLDTQNGTYIYVLARSIYIGLDYSYYEGAASDRMGNYMVHAYIFEEVPPAGVFDMLYCNPAPGSNFFRPLDFFCRRDNAELIELLTGEPKPLAGDVESYAAANRQATPSCVEIALMYAHLKGSGRQLVVKCKATETAPILAGVMALLHPEDAVKTWFQTNYNGYGVLPELELHFINEYYEGEIYADKAHTMDLTAGSAAAEGREREIFGPKLVGYLKAGDLTGVQTIMRFLLSETWQKIKGEPDEVINMVYGYSSDPGTFSLVPFNEKVLQLVCRFITADGWSSDTLLEKLSALIDQRTVASLSAAILTASRIEKYGVSAASLKPKATQAVSEVFCSGEDNAVALLDNPDTGWALVSPYLDVRILAGCRDMVLGSGKLLKWWPELVKLLYGNSAGEGLARVVESALRLMPESGQVYGPVFESVQPDSKKRLDVYLDLFERHQDRVEFFWSLIRPILTDDKLQRLKYTENDNPATAAMLMEVFERQAAACTDLGELTAELSDCIGKNASFRAQMKSRGEGLFGKTFDMYQAAAAGRKPGITALEPHISGIAAAIGKDFSSYLGDLRAYYENKPVTGHDSIYYLLTVCCKHGGAEYARLLLEKFVPLLRDRRDAELLAAAYVKFPHKEPDALIADIDREVKQDQLKTDALAAVLRAKGIDFDATMELLGTCPDNLKETVLIQVHESQYKSWKRSRKVKAFFGNLFGGGKNKAEEKAAPEKEEKK